MKDISGISKSRVDHIPHLLEEYMLETNLRVADKKFACDYVRIAAYVIRPE